MSATSLDDAVVRNLAAACFWRKAFGASLMAKLPQNALQKSQPFLTMMTFVGEVKDALNAKLAQVDSQCLQTP